MRNYQNAYRWSKSGVVTHEERALVFGERAEGIADTCWAAVAPLITLVDACKVYVMIYDALHDPSGVYEGSVRATMDAARASRDAVVWRWAMDNDIANEDVFVTKLGSALNAVGGKIVKGSKRGEEVLSQLWNCYHRHFRNRPGAFESHTRQRWRGRGRTGKGKKVGGSVEEESCEPMCASGMATDDCSLHMSAEAWAEAVGTWQVQQGEQVWFEEQAWCGEQVYPDPGGYEQVYPQPGGYEQVYPELGVYEQVYPELAGDEVIL